MSAIDPQLELLVRWHVGRPESNTRCFWSLVIVASTTGANTPSMSHRMCAPVVEYYGVNGIQTRHPHDVTHEIYRSPRSEVPNTNVAAFLVVADSVAPLIGYAPGPGVMDADLDAAGSTPGVATAAQCSLRTHDEHANGDDNTASGNDNTPTKEGSVTSASSPRDIVGACSVTVWRCQIWCRVLQAPPPWHLWASTAQEQETARRRAAMLLASRQERCTANTNISTSTHTLTRSHAQHTQHCRSM